MADRTSKPERRACRWPKCGLTIVFISKRKAWVHEKKGVDHAPVP